MLTMKCINCSFCNNTLQKKYAYYEMQNLSNVLKWNMTHSFIKNMLIMKCRNCTFCNNTLQQKYAYYEMQNLYVSQQYMTHEFSKNMLTIKCSICIMFYIEIRPINSVKICLLWNAEFAQYFWTSIRNWVIWSDSNYI